MYSVVLIVIMSVVTLCIRAFPFLVFNGKQALPSALEYLQKVLPMASMTMLVVYCLKGVSFANASRWAPEAVSVAVVVALHRWKHNTLLSILAGTVCYMALVQLVFAA